MRAFLTAAAVVTGLVNAFLYNTVGNSPWGGPFVWRLNLGSLFAAHMLSAVLVGLLVSGLLLALAGRKLRGSFFARYGLMAAAICAGGAVLGVLLYNSIVLFDDREPLTKGLAEMLFAAAFPATLGGALGAIEGLILGFPLAGLLGLFGNRNGLADSTPTVETPR